VGWRGTPAPPSDIPHEPLSAQGFRRALGRRDRRFGVRGARLLCHDQRLEGTGHAGSWLLGTFDVAEVLLEAAQTIGRDRGLEPVDHRSGWLRRPDTRT
jgi:hypothetical protein